MEEIEYFWTITMQWSVAQGQAVSTRFGVFTAPSGTTRHEMYQHICATMSRITSAPANAVVLMWTCEPNKAA